MSCDILLGEYFMMCVRISLPVMAVTKGVHEPLSVDAEFPLNQYYRWPIHVTVGNMSNTYWVMIVHTR